MNFFKMIPKLAAAAGLAVVASAAHSSTVFYDVRDGADGNRGPSNLYVEEFGYVYNGVRGFAGKAGMFDVEIARQGGDDWTQLIAFCLEPDRSFGYNNPFQLVDDVLGDIKRMWGAFRADVDTDEEAAGFQLAIWEIVGDSANDDGYDLDAGFFRLINVSKDANLAAVEYATMFLDTESWGAAASGLGRLRDTGSGLDRQDLLVETPLPGTLGLLGLGFAGLGMMRRKKHV